MRQAVGRALRDTLDNLLPLFWISLMWWGTTLLVVTAPAGTIALFAATDPTRQSDDRRPEWRDRLRIVRAELFRSWALAICFAIPVLVLISNLARYGEGESLFRLLTLLWVVILLLVICAGGITCSLRSVDRLDLGQSLRGGVMLTLGHAFRLLLVMIGLWIVTAVCGLLVIPALMVLPGLVGLTFNHITATLTGRSIADALEPTPERSVEEARARDGRYSVN